MNNHKKRSHKNGRSEKQVLIDSKRYAEECAQKYPKNQLKIQIIFRKTSYTRLK